MLNKEREERKKRNDSLPPRGCEEDINILNPENDVKKNDESKK